MSENARYTDEQIDEFWKKADDARAENRHLSDDMFDLILALKDAYKECDLFKQQVKERGDALEAIVKVFEDVNVHELTACQEMYKIARQALGEEQPNE